MDNIYLKSNEDWLHKQKYGYVYGDYSNLVKRLKDSSDEHSELSVFTNIYQFKKTENYHLRYKQIDKIFSIWANNENEINSVEKKFDIKLPLLKSLNNYLVKSKSKLTNEFIKSNGVSLLKRIIREEFPLLGLELVKEFSRSELDKINTETREIVNQYETDSIEAYHDCDSDYDTSSESSENKETYNWLERDYQKEIISYVIDYLLNKKRIYIELATGGGKSYIIYKIISQLMPMAVVVFSPRININQQNTCDKYLSILNHQYLVYNCSLDADFSDFRKRCIRQNKKMLIVACSQGSHKKVTGFIRDNGINDVFIWYDEAHNTIEKWADKADSETSVKYLLEDTESIKHRVFTSASPDKKHAEKHPQIFGELYSPIKVKELIDLGWLCPINCKIFEYDILNIDLLNWILNGFVDNNKSHGFSFHSRDNSAFNLFYKHYQRYLNSDTQIKPYLLIHDDGLNESNKEKLKDIRLNYNFRDVNNFENKVLIEENPRNMAYVVKQFDMGYDFQELNYIVITDPKASFKDIIQCIGRGTRPDRKGPNGTNLEKELLLMLPTYVKEEDTNEYKNIIEVLRYLVLDLEMDIADILIKKINSTESKETTSLDYKGTNENSSKLLDLLYSNNILNRVNTKTLNKFCKKYGIKTEQDYYRFKALNPSLNLKNNLYEYPGFYWKNVVDPNNELYYSSKQECINTKEKIISAAESLKDEEYEELMTDIEDDGWIELNKHDLKIPPYRDLDKFYPQL